MKRIVSGSPFLNISRVGIILVLCTILMYHLQHRNIHEDIASVLKRSKRSLVLRDREYDAGGQLEGGIVVEERERAHGCGPSLGVIYCAPLGLPRNTSG